MAFYCQLASLVFLIVVVNLSTVSSYPSFQNRIPNGQRVPSPCDRTKIWMGVGHKIAAGGGERNPFGQDFEDYSYDWASVCNMDSDRDGQTNGEELGDPGCTWTTGTPSPIVDTITHPGICEPLDSPFCSGFNEFLDCPPVFDCPAVDEEDVVKEEFRFPPTPVPAVETTYICQGFYMPVDRDYHLVATEPIINTTDILHHMVIYACDNVPNDLYATPTQCTMPDACKTIISVWATADGGRCFPLEFGYRIGDTGFKYAILELHWNNPSLASNYVDSSGMYIYYTPNLRENDGHTLVVGQTYLVIPPGLPSISFHGTCTEYCTSSMPHSVNIVEAVLHMHLTGVSGSIAVYRGGNLLQTLVNGTFDYNYQHFVQIRPNLEFQPGDEIRIICEYDSTSRTNITTYGEGTSDEMCFGLVNYYPSTPGFIYCGQYKTAAVCDNQNLQCDVGKAGRLAQVVGYMCQQGCTCACKEALRQLWETGCVTGDVGEVFLQYVPALQGLVGLAAACLAEPPPPPGPAKCAGQPCQNGGTCAETRTGYQCNCRRMFTGRRCQFGCDQNCDPASGCARAGRGKCDSGCVEGYKLTSRKTCKGINYCRAGGRRCKNGGTCRNTADGWYRCRCEPGYGGKRCEYECDPNCASGCTRSGRGKCDNRCEIGFYLLKKKTCRDIRCLQYLFRRKNLKNKRLCGYLKQQKP